MHKRFGDISARIVRIDVSGCTLCRSRGAPDTSTYRHAGSQPSYVLSFCDAS